MRNYEENLNLFLPHGRETVDDTNFGLNLRLLYLCIIPKVLFQEFARKSLNNDKCNFNMPVAI